MVLIYFFIPKVCGCRVNKQPVFRWNIDLLTIYRPPTHPVTVDSYKGQPHLWF